MHANQVFDLWYQYVQRRNEISVESREQGFAEKPGSPLRDDGHFSNPELMQLILDEGNADFIFGVTGNAVLSRRAEG